MQILLLDRPALQKEMFFQVQITAHNRGKDEAALCILPQAGFFFSQ